MARTLGSGPVQGHPLIGLAETRDITHCFASATLQVPQHDHDSLARTESVDRARI